MDATYDPAALSVAIIACDNEATIARTIESVRGLAGRIIVVDSGSSDRTRAISRDLGAEVIEHEWEGHVRQKQFALDQCDTPWVLSLDSDESVSEELAGEIRRVVMSDDPHVAGCEVNRRVWFAGRELRYTWQPEWRTRLVRPQCAKWAGYDPHDRLDVSGPTKKLRGVLRHDAFADVRELLRKQVNHGLHAGESYHAMGRRGSILHLALSPTAAILKQLVFKFAWLDGWPGWACALGAGMSAAAKQMRLLELAAAPRDSADSTP